MKNIENKRKLDRRDTCTPTGAPQTCGNCDLPQNGVLKSLNIEETLSVPGLKTLSNNPDGDLRSGDTVIFQKKEWNMVGMHSAGKSVIIKKEEKR